MKTQPCKCCQDGKPGPNVKSAGYGYNRLEGEVREWAINNRFARSEYCVPVKNGKRFGGSEWQKNKCGNGRMGFLTRRKSKDEVQTEMGLDGQFKRRRHTLLNKRSAKAVVSRRARRVDGSKVGLVSSVTIMEAQRDPVVIAQKEKAYKKMERNEYYRKINRSKLRRGTKRARKHERTIEFVAGAWSA